MMRKKLFLYVRMTFCGLLIAASLAVSVDIGVAQSGQYGRITLVNKSNTTLVLNVKQLYPPTVLASCQAPPNSTCTTGAIEVGLVDLEALSLDGRSRITRTYSLVNGETYPWVISERPR
jgi:hypothetical protein